MSMATRTDTQSPALHVADGHDLIRVRARVSAEIPRRRLPTLARPEVDVLEGLTTAIIAASVPRSDTQEIGRAHV